MSQSRQTRRKATLESEAETTSLSLASITDGQNERGIPAVRFLDDIGGFTKQFDPPASAELLIGAYSDIFSKFKAYETSLNQRRECEVYCSVTCS